MPFKPALVAIAVLAALPAHASDCYSIKDPDLKNHCLATTKQDPSYCYRIKAPDQKNACLAETKSEQSNCYRIQDPDQRNDCLGTLKHEQSYCYRIQDPDERNACLGGVKTERSYCYRIDAPDERNACLAEVNAQRSYCYQIKNPDERSACLAEDQVDHFSPRTCTMPTARKNTAGQKVNSQLCLQRDPVKVPPTAPAQSLPADSADTLSCFGLPDSTRAVMHHWLDEGTLAASSASRNNAAVSGLFAHSAQSRAVLPSASCSRGCAGLEQQAHDVRVAPHRRRHQRRASVGGDRSQRIVRGARLDTPRTQHVLPSVRIRAALEQ